MKITYVNQKKITDISIEYDRQGSESTPQIDPRCENPIHPGNYPLWEDICDQSIRCWIVEGLIPVEFTYVNQ